MADLKAFRKANGLKQRDLAEITGISRSFISQIEGGFSKLPDVYLKKLMSLEGYDRTALSLDHPVRGEENKDSKAGIELALVKAENESLRKELEQVRAEKERYWEMIQKLMK